MENIEHVLQISGSKNIKYGLYTKSNLKVVKIFTKQRRAPGGDENVQSTNLIQTDP